MTSERLAIPGLFLLLVAAALTSMGAPLSLAAIPLGFGGALVVFAIYEALSDHQSPRR